MHPTFLFPESSLSRETHSANAELDKRPGLFAATFHILVGLVQHYD